MTEFVETDFLIALAKEDDWLTDRAEQVLSERDVVTSPFAYLEVLILSDRYQLDAVPLLANLLDLVPVGSDEETQVVLKAVNYFDDGMTPFDSFHAATAETRGLAIRSSDSTYEDVGVERLPLEPPDGE